MIKEFSKRLLITMGFESHRNIKSNRKTYFPNNKTTCPNNIPVENLFLLNQI